MDNLKDKKQLLNDMQPVIQNITKEIFDFVLKKIPQEDRDVDKLIDIIKQQQAKIDKYEEYGGIIDEGKAWAEEAMSHRKTLSELKEYIDSVENESTYNMNYFISKQNIIEKVKKILNHKEEIDE